MHIHAFGGNVAPMFLIGVTGALCAGMMWLAPHQLYCHRNSRKYEVSEEKEMVEGGGGLCRGLTVGGWRWRP